MKENLIDDLISRGEKDFLILEPREEYDAGCVGYSKIGNKLIYDYFLLYTSLREHWKADFSEEDELLNAIEDHLSYNTLRSLSYIENAPIILLEDEEGELKPYGDF